MTNKELLHQAVKSVNQARVFKNLILVKGHKRNTLDRAFNRGVITKNLAKDLEEVTSISLRFWLWPDQFLPSGDRR